MKISFLYCNDLTQVNIGIGSIAAVLKQKGIYPQYLTLTTPDLERKLCTSDFVMMSFTETYFDKAKKYGRLIKRTNPRVKILVGGSCPSVAPEYVMDESWVDMLCVGEGEFVIPEILQDVNRTDVKNVWYRDGKNIIKNPVRPLGNIDDLPFIDRSIFPQEYNKQDRVIIMTGRGCPYSCQYCSNKAMKNIYKDTGTKYCRYRNIDNVILEMKDVIRRYGAPKKGFLFADETFTTNHNRLFEFCDKYEASNIGLPIQCMARPESLLDEGVVARIREIGINNMSIGVECASEERRIKYLNRRYTNDDLITVFDLCHKYGITTNSFNMIGIPEDTPENVRELLDLNLRLNPHIFQVTVLYPFHGTEMRKMYEENGWISDSPETHPISDDYWSPTVSLPGFSAKALAKARTDLQIEYNVKAGKTGYE